MNIKDPFEEQDAEFISFHDLLLAIAETTDISYQKAAEWLYRLLMKSADASVSWWIKTPLRGVILATREEGNDGSLRIARAAHRGTPYRDKNHEKLFEFQSIGFKFNEITQLLIKHGINITKLPSTQEESAITKGDSFPKWKQTMSYLPFLTHLEAASALASINIDIPCSLSDHEEIELAKHEDLIIRSIVMGELQAQETKGTNDDNKASIVWSIKPADLLTWCLKKDMPYPLPLRQAIVEVTESKLVGIRQELHHLTRAVISISHAQNAETKRRTELDLTYTDGGTWV